MGDLDELLDISDVEDVRASEDESEASQHIALLDAITKLNREKDRERRTESNSIVSEFTVGDHEIEKVNVGQLLEALGDKEKLVGISKKVKSIVKNSTALPGPLPSTELVKINREIGYNEVSSELDKWNKVVSKHRIADKLVFPMKRPQVPLETAENVVKRFKASTPLEKEIALLLEKTEEPELGEQVDAKVNPPISIDEALQWRKDIQKMRALQSYQASRARRQKKIKSKSYHRILKRERLNKQSKEFDALKESDPEQFLKKLETLDKQRILERMTLKHRGTGKWAKAQKFRAKYDDSSRKALAEQLQLNRLLTMKHQAQSNDDEPEEIPERMDMATERPNQTRDKVEDQNAAKVSVDPNNFVTVTKDIAKSAIPKLTCAGDFEESDSDDDQRQMILEAFADDDVIDEFKSSKKSLADASKPKEEDLTLPGWGEWGGKGIVISQQKRRRFIKPVRKAKPRKDDNLAHVIINEKQNKNLVPHLVSKVPHPYQTTKQFESSVKTPLGSTWNPETSFRRMVTSSVVTQKGAIIEPLDMEVAKSTGKRKRGRRHN